MSDDDVPRDFPESKEIVERVGEAGILIAADQAEQKVREVFDDFDGSVAEHLGGLAGDLTRSIGGGLLGKLTGLFDADPLEPVSYDVEVIGRSDEEWKVRRVHFVEELSAPYRISLDLMTSFYEVVDSLDGLLGADVVFSYGRNGVFRKMCGVIAEIGTIDLASERLLTRVVVMPALASLAKRVDTRIFQDQTVPKILEEVLGAALGEYGRKLEAERLNDTYRPRDYCVQYKESDLDFCNRIMQEEGIAYHFEVSKDATVETMVLTDHNPGKPNTDFPKVVSVIGDTIPVITKRPESADTESIRGLVWSRHEAVTKVSMRQYNWKRPDPSSPPEFDLEQPDQRGRNREVYVPDDRRRVEDKEGDTSFLGAEVDEDEKPQASKRFEMLSAYNGIGEGSSNVTGFCAGGRFVIAEYPDPNLDQAELLLTRVEHFGDAPDLELGDTSGVVRYENNFTCISADVAYRPYASAVKPKVFGAQTALVTGPTGEEIHTDIHGRIKVKFHWDRVSALDDTSSCWVRVAQMWGGPGWGTWFLPRIGMEVIVHFLDGNPDRPVVVGCVYNGDNEPPYLLPDNKTKTTIKTNSSLGGGGFNELRFEDMKNAEQIYVHAQKDLDEIVLDNRTRNVGSNETIVIQGNRSVEIKGAPANGRSDFKGQTTTIIGSEVIDVDEDRVVTIGGNSVTAVMGGQNLTVGDGLSSSEPAAGKLQIEAENELVLKCGSTSLVMTKDAKITIISGGGAVVVLDQDKILLN